MNLSFMLIFFVTNYKSMSSFLSNIAGNMNYLRSLLKACGTYSYPSTKRWQITVSQQLNSKNFTRNLMWMNVFIIKKMSKKEVY